MNILFVCSGNISRSFLAKMLAQSEIELLKLKNISISSAGLFVYPGHPPDPKMVDYLSKIGITTKKHEPRQMTKEDADRANLILVMEKEHASTIGRLWPEAEEKVELLGEYISEDQVGDDIVDPYGRSPYHYRLAQSQITLAVKSLTKKLALEQTKNHHAQNQGHSR